MYNTLRYNKTRFNRTVITSVPVAPTGETELEPAIVAALKGSTDLAAICGDRVYPSRIPEQCPRLPALAYQIQDVDRVTSLRGAAGLRRVDVELECRSLIKADNRDAREVIRLLFQGFIGNLGQVKIKYISLDTESDEYEQPTQGSDDGTYTKTFSFTFVVREKIPGTEVVPSVQSYLLVQMGSDSELAGKLLIRVPT